MDNMNAAIASRCTTDKKSSYEQELLLKIQDYETTQQRLLSQLKTLEEENNLQKDQLEDAHQQIRKLESENLNLRFEIFELKRKQKDLSSQLEKSKNLHNSSGMNDSYPQSPCFRSFDSKIFDSEPKSYGRQFQLQSEGLGISRLKSMYSEQQLPKLPEDEVQTPKDISSPLSLNSPQRHPFGRSQSFMEPPHPLSERRLNSQKSQILSPQSNKENLNEGNRRKSTFFKEATKKRLQMLEEVPDSATKRKYSRNLTRKLSDDYQTSYADEPSENQHPQFKRMRSYSCDFSEEQNYLSMFNALSENIVSLGVTPQIAMNEWGNDYGQEEHQSQPHAKPKVQYISKDPHLVISDNELEQVGTSVKPNEKQKNLFENFLVLGVENADIRTYIEKHPEAILKTISDFVFAFGVQISKIRASPSFSSLNPIIYASANEDVKSKCFVFPLLSNDQFGNALPLGEIVQESNPNKLLYFVCFLMRDFVTLTDPTKRRKTIKDINYWKTYKVMCFMTYYPLANFFFDVLTKLQEILKIERMMEISQADTQDLTYHQNVDETLTAKFFSNVVKRNLKDLLEMKNIEFSTSLDFKLKGNFIELNTALDIPEKSKAYLMESDWAYPTVFDYFPLKDLLWLFSAMMLERKLVFFSKNLYLLTASLSAISSLLKPFKYPYPMIFNLPDVLFPLCDAPGAALIGINKGEDFLKNSGLFEEYPSCIFVCLDEEKFYLEKTPHKEIPALESFEKALLKSYHKINSNLMKRLVDANKSPNYIPKPKKIKYTSNNDDKNNCIEICQVFKEKLHEKLISFIPKTPIYQDAEQNLDIKKIGKKVVDKAATADKEFVSQFVQTQIFMYFLEQIYHHK